MTKPRRPGTFEDAVCRVAAALGYDEAGAVIGKTGSLIRKAGDPDDEYRLPIVYALALDLAYVKGGHGQPPIFKAYRHNVLLAGASAHNAADPTDRLCEVMAELGELAAETRAATADRRWTATERLRVLAELHETRDALDALERDVQALDVTPKVVRRA